MIGSAARWVEPLAFPAYLGLDAYATRRTRRGMTPGVGRRTSRSPPATGPSVAA